MIFETTTHRNSPTNPKIQGPGTEVDSSAIRQNRVRTQDCSVVFLTRPTAPAIIFRSRALVACADTFLLLALYLCLCFLPCYLLAHRPFICCIFRRRFIPIDHRASISFSRHLEIPCSPTNSIIYYFFFASIFQDPPMVLAAKHITITTLVTAHAPIQKV